jgi:hypothetical protein
MSPTNSCLKARHFAAAILLTLAAPLGARAASDLPPIAPDRPSFTTGPLLVAPGHFQLEGGTTYARTGNEKAISLGEILLRYGVNDRWEARLGLNSYEWIDSGVSGEPRTTGFADPFAQVKIRLNDADAKNRAGGVPAMALVVQSTIPVGARALTADVWQPSTLLALHWDLPASWTIEGDLGYSRLADGSQRFDQVFASLTAGFPITPKLGGYVEVYALSKESAASDAARTRYADAGLSFQVDDNLVLDVRAGVGVDQPHPHWFTGLGASVRF